MKRFVNGIMQEPIWQKRVPRNIPDWLQTATVAFPSGRTAEELVANDAAHLVGGQPRRDRLQPVAGAAQRPRRAPDELRVDLDPTLASAGTTCAAPSSWSATCSPSTGCAATRRRRPKGIHVNVRIVPEWDSLGVRRAALALAREVERRAPELATSKWWKEERHGVFVDYNQNARDRTVASCYSVRLTPDARVSCARLGRGRRRRAGRPAHRHGPRAPARARPRGRHRRQRGHARRAAGPCAPRRGGARRRPVAAALPQAEGRAQGKCSPAATASGRRSAGAPATRSPAASLRGWAWAGCSAASAPSPGRARGTRTSSTTDCRNQSCAAAQLGHRAALAQGPPPTPERRPGCNRRAPGGVIRSRCCGVPVSPSSCSSPPSPRAGSVRTRRRPTGARRHRRLPTHTSPAARASRSLQARIRASNLVVGPLAMIGARRFMTPADATFFGGQQVPAGGAGRGRTVTVAVAGGDAAAVLCVARWRHPDGDRGRRCDRLPRLRPAPRRERRRRRPRHVLVGLRAGRGADVRPPAGLGRRGPPAAPRGHPDRATLRGLSSP